MKHLKAIRKYFWKYRVRLGVGIIFIFLSNYFNVLTPQVTGFVIDFVQSRLPGYQPPKREPSYDYLVLQFIEWMKGMPGLTRVVAWCGHYHPFTGAASRVISFPDAANDHCNEPPYRI
jgi:ATP-binding cassette subfamily B protein